MNTRREFLKKAGLGTAALIMHQFGLFGANKNGNPPNILFAICDDWSWPHASIAHKMGIPGSDPVVQTPTFDRIAMEGVLFTNAYCCAPSCSPSRSAILTGRYIWQLETAANLRGDLPSKFDVYPEVLEKAGYQVGFIGKGWSPIPSTHPDTPNLGVGKRNPAGTDYNSRKWSILTSDFERFLNKRGKDQPFCIWFGGWDSHRPYKLDSGINSGMNPADVAVPACLPDNMTVRKDICDYYYEVQRFDSDVGKALSMLEKQGELENTIVVMCGDNGMPFPRCKVELYDLGANIPLAIRWGENIKGGRTVTDFVNLAEMAPTFIEATGQNIPTTMSVNSLMNVLQSEKEGQVDPDRDKVFTAREYHDYECREGDVGYPIRAVRTAEFLYIRNFEPDRWPAGDPVEYRKERGKYGEVDPCPTKQYIEDHRDDPGMERYFDLSFSKRPAEELYDLSKDPGQVVNVANVDEYAEHKKALAAMLMDELCTTGDPRALGESHYFK